MSANLTFEKVSVHFQILRHDDYNLKATLVNILRKKNRQRQIVTALDHVSLSLHVGDRLGLVGANGSGKTTLLRVAAGVLPPTLGKVKLIPKTLNLLGDAGLGLNPEISGRENLRELALIQGLSWSIVNKKLPQMEEDTGLGERILDPMYTYSAGMHARVRLAVMCQLEPELIVLDEGIGQADREFTQRSEGHIQKMIERTPVVVIASHDEGLLKRYCTKFAFLQDGHVKAVDTFDRIQYLYHQSVPMR